MLTGLVDHLWQSSVVVLVAAALAFALRQHSARIRYWIWLAASLKFLVPFALLTAIGAGFSWRIAETETQTTNVSWIEIAVQIIQPMAARRSIVDAGHAEPSVAESAATERASEEADAASFAAIGDSAESSGIPTRWRKIGLIAAVAVWLLGILAIGSLWLAKYLRLRRLARAALPFSIELPEASGLEIRSSREVVEPGVFGIRRPILLFPADVLDRLVENQLAAIIRHERCHIEQRDNLTALVQMFVACLFWYYPIVWWIGTRLVEERERACDEAVLASGVEPRSYARGIVAICVQSLKSPLPCASGVGGGRLSHRVRTILDGRGVRRLGKLWHAALMAAPFALLAMPFSAGLMSMTPLRAQSQEAGATIVPGSSAPLPMVLFMPSIWVAPDESGRLISGYRTGNSQTSQWFRRAETGNASEPAYIVALTACPAIRPFAIDPDDPDIGPLPKLPGLVDLIAYGYQIDADRVYLANPPTTERISLAFAENALIRHASCRDFVRRALEEDYALSARFDDTTRRLIVESLDMPEPQPQLLSLSEILVATQAFVEVDPAVLETYTGHFARPYSAADRFAPFFEIRHEAGALVVYWNDEEFVVHPYSESEFTTMGNISITGIQLPPSVSLRFLSPDEVRITSNPGSSSPVYPRDYARRIDPSLAAAMQEDVRRRLSGQQLIPVGEPLVRAIVGLLGPDPVPGDSLAVRAVNEIRSRIEAVDPGRIALRGELSSIALREILPSGREVYDIVFQGLALELKVGTTDPGVVEALTFNMTCRRRNAYEVRIAGPCTAPAAGP